MVIHKRSGYYIVVLEPTKTWLGDKKCGGCGKIRDDWVVKRLRYNTCSTDCTDKMNTNYKIFGWSDMRERVFERDKYVCVICKNETIQSLIEEETKFLEQHLKVFDPEHKQHLFITRLREWLKSQLDADHIIPVSLGGDEWSFDNIQTLCKQCHKNKTKKDMKKISAERKITTDQTRLV